MLDGATGGLPRGRGLTAAMIDPGQATAELDPLEAEVLIDLRHIDEERRGAAALAGRSVELDSMVRGIDGALGGSIDVLDEIRHALRDLVEGAAARSAETAATVEKGIASLVGILQQRTGSRAADLRTLNAIGNHVKMLGLQASIEAGIHRGDNRGFDVVAVEVRRLATAIVETSHTVGTAMDDALLEQTAHSFRATFASVVSAIEQATGAAVDDADTGLVRASQRLGDLRENQRVVRALSTSLAEAAARMEEKLSWAGKVSRLVGSGTHTGERLRPMSGGDRLDRVLASGVLRVAIEPDFKGLSFRPHGAAGLQGLDVEYATAFARWLGTRIQLIPYPWDRCPELLQTGQRPGEQEADLVWSSLPRVDAYAVPMAMSNPYTYLPFVLARRPGDPIAGLPDLAGKVVGCINDPSAISVLERRGVRWPANTNLPGGQVRVANLLAYSDQSRIHDCLSDGDVDAFVVDLPIYHWAATDPASPWCGRIEILPGNLDDDLWRYAVGAAADVDSARLLAKVDEFIAWFTTQPERAEIEQRWQGHVYPAAPGRADEQDVVTPDDLLRRAPRSTAAGHQLTRRANDLALHASVAASAAASVVTELTERVAHIGTRLAEAQDEIRGCSELPEALNGSISRETQSRADALRHPLEQLLEQLAVSAETSRDVLLKITRVARRLQLLGLNAKIEAMRAGDTGRAFAVLAEEVHHLAIQAAGVTERIAASLDTQAVSEGIAALQHVTDHTIAGLRERLTTAMTAAFSQLTYVNGGFEQARDLATRLESTSADTAVRASRANDRMRPAAEAQRRR